MRGIDCRLAGRNCPTWDANDVAGAIPIRRWPGWSDRVAKGFFNGAACRLSVIVSTTGRPMKVTGTGASEVGSIRRRKRSQGVSQGGFASELSSGPESAARGGVGAVEVLDGVLAIQEVGDEGDDRRKAHAHGEQVLQRLEQIRMGLLAGRIPTHQLNELVRALRQRPPQFTDPRLGEILAEIELRASVELAKLGHYD